MNNSVLKSTTQSTSDTTSRLDDQQTYSNFNENFESQIVGGESDGSCTLTVFNGVFNIRAELENYEMPKVEEILI